MASKEEVTDLRLRAQHLFALCDKEEKGFVTKRDMQRMKNEMPLEPEQLEIVFDSLDLDGNGFLTFDEFIQGFGIYLEEDEVKQDPAPSKSCDEIKEEEEADEEEFMNLLEGLGGKKVFEEEDTVKELWNHLRQDDPDATFQFEKLLEKLSNKIHMKDQEKVSMEEFIRNQNETREEQMRRLYEEMDQQIKQEKELTLQTERLRETQLKIELRAALEKKDREVESLQAREKDLLERLNRLEESESSSKQELAVLLKEKRRLENQLELQSRNVDDLQSSLKKTRQDSVKERRERAMAAFSVSESIAMEREGLVEQLNMLRSINTRLTDESDLRDLSDGGGPDDEDGLMKSSIARQLREIEEDENDDDDDEPLKINNADVHLKEISDLMIQNRRCPIKTDLSTESNVSSLFDELASALDPSASFDDQEQDTLPIVIGAARPVRKIASKSNNNSNRIRGFKLPPPVYESKVSIPIRPASVQPESWTTVTQGNHVVTWIVQSSIPGEKDSAEDKSSAESDWISAVNKENCVVAALDATSSADSMIGYHNNRWTNQVHLRKREPITPSTVFKIIVIGDAGCGKTSFIRRFCCDDFIGPGSSSTIGIDLSVRCVSVGNDQQVALQFWDTAGKRIRQEKYRSITKQYLRKADGIIIMYDVTSEESFINVRHWMESIKEVVEEDVVRVLVGNKMDLLDLPSPPVDGAESDGNKVSNRRTSRQVPTATGLQLSEESGGNFFETSAKTGYMIHQCVVAMAAKLQVRQDCIMEKVLLGLAGADPNKADGVEDLREVADDEKSKCCNV